MRAYTTHKIPCRLAALALLVPALPVDAAGPPRDFIAHSNQDGWVLHSNQDPGPVEVLAGGQATHQLILGDHGWPVPEPALPTLETMHLVPVHGNSPSPEFGGPIERFRPVMAPVPGPATAPLLALGALVAAGGRRRRRAAP